LDAFVSTGQGILGNNMFAYCLNNPLVFTDSCGNRAVAVKASKVDGDEIKKDDSL